MIESEIPTRNYILGLVVGLVFVCVGAYFLIFHFGRDMRIWLATRDGVETPVIQVMDAQLHNGEGEDAYSGGGRTPILV